jgi:hypothetical protein
MREMTKGQGAARPDAETTPRPKPWQPGRLGFMWSHHERGAC